MINGKRKLVPLADITAARYAGRVVRVPERRYSKERGEHFVDCNVKITPIMAARIAESVRRISEHLRSPSDD